VRTFGADARPNWKEQPSRETLTGRATAVKVAARIRTDALASGCWRAYACGMYVQAKRVDFSVAIKSRGKPPNPWRWEIYRAGRSTAVALSSDFFPTTGAAFRAGKQALAELFEKQRIRE
jgi:hypothetical protein